MMVDMFYDENEGGGNSVMVMIVIKRIKAA